MISVLLFSIAIAPVVAIIMYVYLKDRYEREPKLILLYSFFWGCISVIPAAMLETMGSYTGLENAVNPALTFLYTFGVVALSEEFSKYLFLRYYCFRKESFNEPYDGIVYAVMVGMGFAFVENLMYVFTQPDIVHGFQTAGIRMFTAVPAHATFAAVMGYYTGLAKFEQNRKISLLTKGLLAAIVLHGSYDFFLFQKYLPGLTAGAMVSLVLGIQLSRRAIRQHAQNSPFKKLS